jgi:hypothetical protein
LLAPSSTAAGAALEAAGVAESSQVVIADAG